MIVEIVSRQRRVHRFSEFVAPDHWKAIDFISDLHLWQNSPRTFTSWANYMQHGTADAVFILGDLFEVWVGDDARHEPFEAACIAVLQSAAASRFVGFMQGNRDFLVGPEMLADSAMTFLHDPMVLVAFGARTLLSHGDELCLDDVDYQRFRAMVRSPTWQQQFLAKPLEERKVFVRQLRNDSEKRKRAYPHANDWADLDKDAVLHWMDEASAPVLVHGHTHRPGDETLAPGRERRVLSDWDLDAIEPSNSRSEVLRLTAKGFQRISPLAAARSLAG